MTAPKANIRIGATDETGPAFASIQRSIDKLALAAAVQGKSAREAKLHELATQGATRAQLAAADAALKLTENQARAAAMAQRLRAGMVMLGAVAGTALVAAAAAVDNLIKGAGDFQDMAERIGDSAENVASLAVAAGTAGTELSEVEHFSIKLSKALVDVDGEGKKAAQAIKDLGLNVDDFKKLNPTDQLEAIAKALRGFADGQEKTQVLEQLAKGGAQLLPFLKELGAEQGRQKILTEEQIAAADEYADKQARARTEIKLHAEAIAIGLLPQLNEFTEGLRDLSSDSDFAATASEVLQGALRAGITIFQTIAVVASDVGFVFKGVGREIGAITAQLAALARGDLTGFHAISDAVREDAERARAELDRFQARVMAIGEKKPPAAIDPDADREARRFDRQALANRPRLKVHAVGGKDKGSDEAKAQRDLDLEQIRKQSEALRAIYDGDEKILEAKRAANLLNDREYFQQKRDLFNLQQDEQERALQKEIDLLSRQQFTGKDKLENDRKLADAQFKLTKVRNDAGAALKVLSIQEVDSVERIKRAYADATIEAKELLDTIARRNSRDVAAVGRGDEFRARQSDLNEIEERYLKERSRLQREKRNNPQRAAELDEYLKVARSTYEAEVRLYQERTAAIESEQADWVNGFTRATENYLDEAHNFAKQSEGLFDNVFKSGEDALANFAKTGKANIRDLASSWADAVTRMAAKQVFADGLQALKSSDTFGRFFRDRTGSQTFPPALPDVAKAASDTSAQASAAAAANSLASAESTAATAIANASTSSAQALAAVANAAYQAASALASIQASSAASSAGSLFGAVGSASGSDWDVFTSGLSAAYGRAIGGPVSAGGLYQVNERKRPELLQVAGKSYLMMGSQGGTVKSSTDDVAPRAPTVVQVTVAPPPGASRETAGQWGAAAGRAINHALRRNG